MFKKLSVLLLLFLTACNLPFNFLPTLPPTLEAVPTLTSTPEIIPSAYPVPSLAVSPSVVVVTATPTQADSPTATKSALSPTVAASPTSKNTSIATKSLATATPTVILPSATFTITLPALTATATSTGAMAYKVQSGTPLLTANFAHPTEGCNWLSVAGQVFDASGNEVLNVVVHVSGTLNGKPIDLIGMTGVALDYGPGGYEVQLASQAIDSTGTLVIQLLDLQAHPLSQPVAFNTSADCQKNVTLINFAP